MGSKKITSGWRGLSIAKQVDINTPATVDTAFNFEGDPIDIEVNEAQDNGDEVTSLNEPDREGTHQTHSESPSYRIEVHDQKNPIETHRDRHDGGCFGCNGWRLSETDEQ